MKKVIMFPGQGSQYVGMGKSLFTKYKKETEVASDMLGYSIKDLCLFDPKRELSQTQFTQPALYVVNHFLYKELNHRPDFLIGHSLGEYNALLAAKVFDFRTGLKLVKKRGELMAQASGGGMAAVLGLSYLELEKLLLEEGYIDIDIANYNTPTQIVVSGPKERIHSFIDLLDSKKVRVVPLIVSAAFHSRYMKQASISFSSFINHFTFEKPAIPVIANVTARPYLDTDIKELLGSQIKSSVAWCDSIRYLIGLGATDFRELGKGILSRMVKNIQENCDPIMEDKIVVKRENRKSSDDTTIKDELVSKNWNTELNEDVELSMALGSSEFRKDYGVSYSYLAGAMYRGTASKELVISMGSAGMIGFLGTGGMRLEDIGSDIDAIQRALKDRGTYGMNLLHNMIDPEMEFKTVDLYLEKGVHNIEAAAFMQITLPLVYFHARGLSRNTDGSIDNNHRILAKISRPEVASSFMQPAPVKLLNKLFERKLITAEQIELASKIPMSYDICVEADSGGHTDGGVALVLLPAIQRLRDEIQNKYAYSKIIRVGLAGGIGTPQSAACAFVMGADFVLTGSINQCTVEAGTSDAVKDLLQTINVQDTDYAPAGDMFEIGAKVQVLKKGVLFASRAKKLYNLYNQYNSLEEIPEKTIKQLERSYFKRPLGEIWNVTKEYFMTKDRESEIIKAEQNPRHKMALVFRWYFGFSSRIAFEGDIEKKVDFQIHTGPALGAFNQWVKGTELESWRNRHVDQIGRKLMRSTAELLRKNLSEIIY